MEPPSRTRVPGNIPRPLAFEVEVVVEREASVAAARHDSVPYGGGAGGAEVTGAGVRAEITSVGVEEIARRGGGGDAGAVVRRWCSMEEGQDPWLRTRSGAEYSKHGWMNGDDDDDGEMERGGYSALLWLSYAPITVKVC